MYTHLHITLSHTGPHYTHTLTILTHTLTILIYPLTTLTHTIPHLISLVKLCKFLHLVLLQASWDFLDVVGEDGNDPMEDSEHAWTLG